MGRMKNKNSQQTVQNQTFDGLSVYLSKQFFPQQNHRNAMTVIKPAKIFGLISQKSIAVKTCRENRFSAKREVVPLGMEQAWNTGDQQLAVTLSLGFVVGLFIIRVERKRKNTNIQRQLVTGKNRIGPSFLKLWKRAYQITIYVTYSTFVIW